MEELITLVFGACDLWLTALMLAFVGLFILWSVTWGLWNKVMPKDPGEPIGTCHFADGRARHVYEDDIGQFIIGADGEPVHGVWLRPEESTDEPMIVGRK
jgi:hypothetical protein